MIQEALYSSRTEEWPTPQSFFNGLDGEFHFTLDPCATAANAKCATYFTKEQDGLVQDWGTHYRATDETGPLATLRGGPPR
jgi:site-specific DNA-methyltransferase (adenine-specific)